MKSTRQEQLDEQLSLKTHMNAEREAYVSDLKIKVSRLHQYLDSKFNELVTAYDNDTMDDNNAVQ